MHVNLENPPIVLIVKDDQDVLELLVDLLEPEGYKVFAAQNAKRALELTATVRADIILCDVVMPGMNGLELCAHLKADPHTSDIPVMLVSAVKKEDVARLEGFAAGADDYLEIPFRTEELLIKVARLIERLRAERALLKSEAEYRLLFKANPCSMYLCDEQSLQFLAVNDAAIKHYGYSREEFLSMTIRDIRREEDVPALMADMANLNGENDNAGVWTHRKKDGTLIDVEVTWHKIDFRNLQAYLVLANDVTEKNKAEQALRESEHRYREIFDNANDIIYTHDLNGKFTSLNQTGAL
jgi:PAS domain S-box-containing protein